MATFDEARNEARVLEAELLAGLEERADAIAEDMGEKLALGDDARVVFEMSPLLSE